MAAITLDRPRRLAHFLRNLLEMTGAMLVGMLVGGLVFAAVLAPWGSRSTRHGFGSRRCGCW